MSVLLLIALALPGGLATALLGTRRSLSFAVGLATAVACVVAAASIDASDVVPLAGSVIGGSDGLRTLATVWAASTLLFGIIDALLGKGPAVLGPALVGLAFGSAGLAVADHGIGFALLIGGALLVAIVPLAGARGDSATVSKLGIRSARSIVAAGVLSLLVVAWGASPAGPLSAIGPLGSIDPTLETAMGLALLAIVGAVAIRMGAIPAHAWAARFAETMPASVVPPVLGWGAAAFALVALGWIEVTLSPTGVLLEGEHLLVALLAALGIVLAGIAAVAHDDLEHVLAYAIVQDAGIAILAFASNNSLATAAGRDWIIAAVAVKAGLSAWVLVMRATFGVHRRVELSGWARRAPILGVAFGLVLVSAVGLPGVANFEARAALVQLALPGPIAAIVLLAAFAPLLFLGRLLVVGLGAASGPVRAARHADITVGRERPDGWAGDSSPVRMITTIARDNRHPLAAATAVLVAVVGLSVAIGGLGSTAATDAPAGASSGSAPSGLGALL